MGRVESDALGWGDIRWGRGFGIGGSWMGMGPGFSGWNVGWEGEVFGWGGRMGGMLIGRVRF